VRTSDATSTHCPHRSVARRLRGKEAERLVAYEHHLWSDGVTAARSPSSAARGMFRTAPRPDSLARHGSPPKALRLPRCPPPPLRADQRRRSGVPLAAGGRPLRRHRSPRRDGHHAVVPRRLARHGTGLLDGDRCLTAAMPCGPAPTAIDSVGRPCRERTATRPLPRTATSITSPATAVWSSRPRSGVPKGPMGSRLVSGLHRPGTMTEP
jgi:hypothetical protein